MSTRLLLAAALLLLPDLAQAQAQRDGRPDRPGPSGNGPSRPGPSKPGGGGSPPGRPGGERPGGSGGGQTRPPRPVQPPRPNPGRPETGRPNPSRPNPSRPNPGHPNPSRPNPPGHGRPDRPRPPEHRPGAGRPPQFRPIHGNPFRYPRGYAYRKWTIGLLLPRLFLSSSYYFDGYGPLGIGAPPPGCRWVRYGPDLLLVSVRTGKIVDVIYGAFY